MFFGTRKTLMESGIFQGITDFHTHILPGVDDGFQTMAQSIEALKNFEELGIKEVWFTPHIMEDYPNQTDALQQLFATVSSTYATEDCKSPIELHLAAEYMLDLLFMQRLNTNDLLPIIDRWHLLVETSYYNPPLGFKDILAQIVEKGYKPVLAHPERYHYMSMKDYEELHGKGIIFQLDTFSLLGAYGREAAEKSQILLNKGFYTLAGSDIHKLELLELMTVPVKKKILTTLKTLMMK